MTIASRIFARIWKLSPRLNGVEVERAVKVEMRDGVHLLTDIFKPSGVPTAPTVLLRSPYGRGSIVDAFARVFAERGYVAVLQSVRGTFGSEGSFNPFFQERSDGLDTVDWIERQPWYDGKLGLFGVSYLGQVQWAIAAALGDRVSAISLDRTTADFVDAILDGGGFRLEDFLTWSSMISIQERSNAVVQALKRVVFGDPLTKDYRKLPLRTMDETVIGHRLPYWRDWLDHPDPHDQFWAPIRDRKSLANVTAPINLSAGWSDLFIGSEFQDYLALKAAGATVRMAIDEGTHSGFGSQGARMRGAFEWFDIHLKGQAANSEDLTRTRVWMNGEKAWRDVKHWPGEDQSLKLYPSPDLALSDESNAGEVSFCWSPANPTPSGEGPTLVAKTGRGDTRSLAARDDVLSFTGPVLGSAVDILGQPIARLEISADAPAHDLFVCLCDVRPDSKSTNISDGYVRLPATEPGARRVVEIALLAAGWRVEKGHRIQLLVAGGAFPRYARHLGTTEPSGSATAMRDVNISLHAGPGTSLHLPVA